MGSATLQLHLVHWNTTKFRSLDEAMSRDDGLCVLAVFLQVTQFYCCRLLQKVDVRRVGDDIVC